MSGDNNKMTVQIGFDDGQQVLKLMQTVKGLEVEGDEIETKRRKYSEGYKNRESLMSSVKKLFIICAVPNVDESYHNVKQIMEKVKCETIDFGMSCDLKMCLCLCGKQTASSKHPCPYCYARVPFHEEAQRTTLESLNLWYQQFLEAGGNKAKAMDFKNVTRRPLLAGQPEDLVLDLLIPPELHCMTGVAGKLLKEMERGCFQSRKEGKKFVNTFLKANNIQKCVYQGSESFEGNQARKLLQVSYINPKP